MKPRVALDHSYMTSSDAAHMKSVQDSQESKFFLVQLTPKDNVSHTIQKDMNDELESPASTKVCRICLACNVKMYHIGDYKLSQYFQHFTGIQLQPEDQLPKVLCWECVGRLLSASRFREKALRAHSLLTSKVKINTYMSLSDVKSINRIRNKLQSTLTMKYFEKDHSDLVVNIVEDVKLKAEVKCDEDDNSDDNEVMSEVSEAEMEVKHEDPLVEEAPPPPPLARHVVVEVANVTKAVPDVKFEVPVTTPRAKGRQPHGAARKRPADSLAGQARSPPTRKRKDDKSKKAVGPDDTLFTITPLTQAEQVAEVQRRRETYDYATALYKCDVCYKVFHTQASYDVHSYKHNDKSGSFECPICKSRVKSARALRDHTSKQHSHQYSCNKCSFSSKHRGAAKQHELFHTGVKYKCPSCPKQFDVRSTCLTHMRLKHPSRFVCELCGFAFITEKGVNVHKNNKHKLDKDVELTGPYCAECDLRFLSEEAHARHLKLSARHRRDDDPEPLNNDPQKLLNRKKPVGPAEGPVTCEQCGEQCTDHRAYGQHFLRAHPGVNRTQYAGQSTCMCDQCGKIFQTSVQLKGHMWVHTGNKPYKCDLCNRTFSNRTSLHLHKVAHSGDKVYKCDQCDKSFRRYNSLYMHKKSHTGSKPFKCDKCERAFKSYAGLHMHKRSHSDTRPTFECAVCGKNFSTYSNRSRHMIIHSGLKPFNCDTCGKSFKSKAEQRLHIDHVHLKVPWPKRTRSPRVRC